MDTSKNTDGIKKLNTSKILKFKNKMGIKLAALALALGIGSFSLINKPDDTLTVGVTKDILEDNYANSIPLYSDPRGQQLLTTISSNKLIIAQDNIKDYQHPERLHLISVINEDNKVIFGYTYQKYMGQITKVSQKNTSFLYRVNEKNGINLRKSPEISDNKLTSIPKNSILIGAKSQENEQRWTNVIYFNGSTIKEGFASGKYLEQISNINECFNNNNKGLTFDSPKDNEFGIDVSHIDPKVLDKLLKGEIKLPEVVEKISGKKANISQFDKNIKFVYIKAIGTAPFSKELKRGKSTPYKELAKVCEKNKIPFGFYCYSTCTTRAEAKSEYKIFSEVLNQIKDNPYHLLPLAIDIEITNDKDRQYNVSMEELTNSKIALTNMLEKDFGKTILYVPRNAYNDKLKSRILDLEQYQKGLNSGNSHIWHVTPLDSKLHKESLLTIAEHVTANQIALDVKIGDKRNNLIDINLINKEAFSNYISGRYVSLNKEQKNNNKPKYLAQNDKYER